MSSKLQSLLNQVKLLPDLEQRRVGCLLGAAVADAASRPFHWVYDLPTLNTALEQGQQPNRPEFWPESQSPFYSLPTGENSCYWDEAMAVLTSIQRKGGFDFQDMCESLVEELGPTSQYNMEKREEYMELRRYGRVQGPIQGKWLHGGMIKFFQNRKRAMAGGGGERQHFGDPHIKETDGFCCSLPVVVKHVGEKDLMDKVKLVTQTQSTWPVAVDHAMVAASIVQAALLHPDRDPVDTVREEVRAAHPEIYQELEVIDSVLSIPHTEAVGRLFGRPCYNPGSFMGAIHAVKTSESFAEAVRKTIKAGGCNCSRSFFIGAILGARQGVEGIPPDWIQKTRQAEEVLEKAISITNK